LARYVDHGDERAFADLVRRHGGLVQEVCQRVLRHQHDAEDAFQATFMVLARRASSLDGTRSLSNWLYQVAYRTALKARSRSARLRARESSHGKPEAIEDVHDAWRLDLGRLLDEELHELPEKYRAPLVLCYLYGKTHQEAAHELGWPSGSMSTRMSRARDLLRERLSRRGVTD
jgi:RNA polymerase sigma factor (sigma-70 family)